MVTAGEAPRNGAENAPGSAPEGGAGAVEPNDRPGTKEDSPRTPDDPESHAESGSEEDPNDSDGEANPHPRWNWDDPGEDAIGDSKLFEISASERADGGDNTEWCRGQMVGEGAYVLSQVPDSRCSLIA